ncbi:MAG: helix-turn-helix domain-containing protein [Eubacterium sp.]|nr:helix-turn-helix domain-containing protein [Eubacterium sp.]
MAEDVLDEMETCIDETVKWLEEQKKIKAEKEKNDTIPEEKTSVGRKMAYCRKILRFSLEEMADIFEITPYQLLNYETDVCDPPLTTLLFYAEYFEIPMEHFVDDLFTIQRFRVDYCIFQFVKFKTIYKFFNNK